MKTIGSGLEQWNMAVNSFWTLLCEEKKLPDTTNFIMVMGYTGDGDQILHYADWVWITLASNTATVKVRSTLMV